MAATDAQRRQPVGEVTMDFADGGSFVQSKLGDAIVAAEKLRKEFIASLATESVERAKLESTLKEEDVNRLVKEFSITSNQAKSCLVKASGNLDACIAGLVAGDIEVPYRR